MSRTIEQVAATGGGWAWPEPGWITVLVTGAEEVTRGQNQTPALQIRFATDDAAYVFADNVFLTPRSVGRLALVAWKLCGLDSQDSLPDDNDSTISYLTEYIKGNLPESVDVLVEEKPDRKGTLRKNVAFSGYRNPVGDGGKPESVAEPEPEPTGTNADGDTDLPF